MDTGLDTVKTASKKVVYKAGEFIRNKMADKVTKWDNDNIEKKEPAEEIIIPPENRDYILDKLRKLLSKQNTIKYSND